MGVDYVPFETDFGDVNAAVVPDVVKHNRGQYSREARGCRCCDPQREISDVVAESREIIAPLGEGSLNMRWRPKAHSVTEVEIPVIVLKHSAKAHQRWKDAQGPWKMSGYTDSSAFGRFARLIDSGRFRPPKGGQAPYKFGEFYTALRLERMGYTCWSAVHLFQYGKKNQYAEFSTRNTNEVRDQWSDLPWPSAIQRALAFQPRNPDIVACHPRKGWLFCEVKRLNDRIKIDQVRALAVLHLLTGAPVAIVRVVPKGERTNWKPCVAEILYVRSAHRAAWLHPSHKLLNHDHP